MVDDVPVIGPRHVDHRMVPRPARDLEILLQNLAHRLERSDRARPHRIGDAVIGAGPAALRPHEIIDALALRSEEHTSELQSLMRISYAVFCLKKKKQENPNHKS